MLQSGPDRFPRLFERFTLGKVRMKNRLVALAHGTGMVRDGLVTDEDIAYWTELASSGVGVIIQGGMTVHPAATLRHRNRVEAYSEDAMDGLRRRCAALKVHDAVLLGQLTHIGRDNLRGTNR